MGGREAGAGGGGAAIRRRRRWLGDRRQAAAARTRAHFALQEPPGDQPPPRGPGRDPVRYAGVWLEEGVCSRFANLGASVGAAGAASPGSPERFSPPLPPGPRLAAGLRAGLQGGNGAKYPLGWARGDLGVGPVHAGLGAEARGCRTALSRGWISGAAGATGLSALGPGLGCVGLGSGQGSGLSPRPCPARPLLTFLTPPPPHAGSWSAGRSRRLRSSPPPHPLCSPPIHDSTQGPLALGEQRGGRAREGGGG